MAGGKRYDRARVLVTELESMRASWQGPDRRPVLGTAHLYGVRDENFGRLNEWVFSVQVPRQRAGQIVVAPLVIPGKRAWASLSRRSIVFVPATRRPYHRFMYCKLNVADPSGARTKIGIRRGEKAMLPKWFDGFESHLKVKSTVARTRGRDDRALVAIAERDAHALMIELFFALKVWVLQEAVQVKA
jgi:hypothetical protein